MVFVKIYFYAPIILKNLIIYKKKYVYKIN